MSGQSPDFSFDVYPGLDAELDAAFERNIALGHANPAEIAPAGLAAVVQETLQQNAPESLPDALSPQTAHWIETMDFASMSESWTQYEALTSKYPVPKIVVELMDQTPWGPETIERLYHAHDALSTSGETTAAGVNISETMQLALIPWAAIRDNLDDFPGWVKKMRDAQGIATSDDFINPDIVSAIQSNAKFYRNTLAGQNFQSQPLEHPWFSAREYVNQRITHDGNWGVMLVQTSKDAGIQRLNEGASTDRTPNALTAGGQSPFRIAGEDVGAMGIFEWVALSLQEDPQGISAADYSWLLANCIEDANGVARVPCGYWNDGQVESDLDSADFGDGVVRPRLAVM